DTSQYSAVCTYSIQDIREVFKTKANSKPWSMSIPLQNGRRMTEMCLTPARSSSGSVLKAVNYNGEMVIIEEVQLLAHSEPVKILGLSSIV
ncbi:semaphorin-4E-like isoform X1, partial [Clarias magur]